VSGGAERRRRDEAVYVPCFWLSETPDQQNTGYGDNGIKYREYRAF
jgi:hypothetical protein